MHKAINVMTRNDAPTAITRGTELLRAAFAFALVVCPLGAAADVTGIVNNVRAAACPESSSQMPMLRTEQRLDDAAGYLADGMNLESATQAAKYSAKLSASIRVRTLHGDDGLSQMLASQFCDIVADPRLTEIGVYQHGAEFWLVLATPFTPPDSVNPAELDRRVLQLVNEARGQARRCGFRKFAATTPLRAHAALRQAAQLHAQDMATHDFLAHEGSSGSDPGDRATMAGYTWSTFGENVAAGQTTAEEVIATWLASSEHCKTLMSPEYADTGVAHATNRNSDKGTYWVQIFGTSQ